MKYAVFWLLAFCFFLFKRCTVHVKNNKFNLDKIRCTHIQLFTQTRTWRRLKQNEEDVQTEKTYTLS